MQMDGGIAYNDAAGIQDTCCRPFSSVRETRAHAVGHGGLECPNSQVSRFPAAVSSLLTELNDDSGVFLKVPIGLFILRATGSLLLSFAGGDTASLVGPSHSGAAWASVQHRITAHVGSVAGCS